MSTQGVALDPDMIQAMLNWPPPSTPSELRSFLGLTCFYRKFIHWYAALVEPLTLLLRKDQFTWNSAAQQAFDKLKHLMTTTSVLATPNFSILFTLETDACGTAMGVVLLQNSRPITYFSKVFCPRIQRASTYVHELHAITVVVRKWSHYLLGSPFIILTDHRSLKDLMTQVIQTLRVASVSIQTPWVRLHH